MRLKLATLIQTAKTAFVLALNTTTVRSSAAQVETRAMCLAVPLVRNWERASHVRPTERTLIKFVLAAFVSVGFVSGQANASEACDANTDCQNGICARPEYNNSTLVCCASGNSSDVFGRPTCTELAEGKLCSTDGENSDEVCASGVCISGFCVSGRANASEACDANADCQNGVCGRPEYNNSTLVCCASDESRKVYGRPTCTELAEGKTCLTDGENSDKVCASGICENGICA